MSAIILLYIIALYKQPQNSQFGTLLVVKNVAAIVKAECVQRAIIILYQLIFKIPHCVGLGVKSLTF